MKELKYLATGQEALALYGRSGTSFLKMIKYCSGFIFLDLVYFKRKSAPEYSKLRDSTPEELPFSDRMYFPAVVIYNQCCFLFQMRRLCTTYFL